MKFDLKKNTILLTVAGSRAYGMSQESSDVDLKGVCIPPQEYRDGFLYDFAQADKKSDMEVFYDNLTEEEREKGAQGEVEGSVYEIRKFFRLAAQNNPNVLDALFCRDEDIRHITFAGETLRNWAQSFISAKCRWTFGGYAKAQLKRIDSHRRWLLSPPDHKPTRKEFGLPDQTAIPQNQLAAAQAEIRKKIDSWEVDYGNMDEADKIYIQDQMAEHWAEMKVGSEEKYAAAARLIGYNENFIHLLEKERRYRSSLTNFNQYLTWKDERNKERAAMEAKFLFDTKHGSHLVRLLRMCREILTDGKINVWREDAEELLSIRRGEWTYDDLMVFVDEEEEKINEAFKISTLPAIPDKEKLNKLCYELIRMSK